MNDSNISRYAEIRIVSSAKKLDLYSKIYGNRQSNRRLRLNWQCNRSRLHFILGQFNRLRLPHVCRKDVEIQAFEVLVQPPTKSSALELIDIKTGRICLLSKPLDGLMQVVLEQDVVPNWLKIAISIQ